MGIGSDAVLLVSADQRTRDACRAWLAAEGLNVHEARSATEALEFHRKYRCLLTISDARLPEFNGLELLRRIRRLNSQANVALVSDPDAPESSLDAFEAGAIDCLDRPLGRPRLIDLTKMVMDRVQAANPTRPRAMPELREIVAVSAAMRAVRAAASQAATRSTPVLLTGPRGAGKEAIARAIHAHGDRKDRPFVVMNCAVVPTGLLDGELFGFRARAFPGPDGRHVPLVEQCSGGTLFLDEVSTLGPAVQQKLLELIHHATYRAADDGASHQTDIRVIAATREPFDGAVLAGEFDRRLDEVLRSCTLCVPGLSERAEDIVPLTRHFLEMFEGQIGRSAPRLSREAASYLTTRIWPGGVRELRNAIERAVIANPGGRLCAADFRDAGPETRSPGPCTHAQPWILPHEGIDLDALNRTLTVQALERTRFKVSPAARLLGLSRATLRYRIRKYGLGRTVDADPGRES